MTASVVRSVVARAAICATLLTAACSDEDPISPGTEDEASLTVDATTSWAYVNLESGSAVTVTEPTAASNWDMAFFATGVMLNGGSAGPAGVVGTCLCQNAGATEAQVQAMTPASELADFEGVTLASVPAAASAWESDALAPAIAGWYAYNPATHQVSAAPALVWKLRLAEATNPGYAKFHVTGIANATQAHAGQVTIEYAVQDALGAPLGETRTAVLDVSDGSRVYFDFKTGAESDASDWDISLEGWELRLNSGVSGTGKAGAVLATNADFATMTDASDAPAQIYKADAFGGVFTAKKWYRYNLDGNNTIFPTYDVYLIKRGDDVYKVQITGYYHVEGDARHITFRYAKLTD